MTKKESYSLFKEPSLVICLFTISLLLAVDIPTWAFIAAMVTWIWKLLGEKFGMALPSRFLTGFFSVVFFAATYFYFQVLIGRDPGATFLVILAGLKVLECKSESEKGFLVFIGLILMVLKFLYSIDLIYTIMAGPLFIGLLFNLLPSSLGSISPRIRFLLILKYVLAALPITFFLYVFFPRISQEFVNTQNSGNRAGKSGFNDQLNPGDISNLIQSDELVFRAEFPPGNNLSQRDLYWRGAILTEPQGFHWRRVVGDFRGQRQAREVPQEFAELPNYTITMEPSETTWLFTLGGTDFVLSPLNSVYKQGGSTFKILEMTEGRIHYKGFFKKKMGIPEEKRTTTLISPNYSKAIKNLVMKWKAETQTKEASLNSGINKSDFSEKILEKIIDYYKKNNFHYSLQTADQGEASLDEFLLQNKLGYCEHFASATALLLLAAGVPARVVVGYQGGDFNYIGNFWNIRQKDAHAWIEYLNGENRWIPFDPVIFIAPLRIELGAEAFSRVVDQKWDAQMYEKIKQEAFEKDWQSSLAFWYENINYRWNKEIIDFSPEKQKLLMESLGEHIGPAVLVALLLAISISFLMNILFSRRSRRRPARLVFEMINQFLRRYNLERKVNEGPQNWRDRVIQALPQEHVHLHNLFDCYIELAYQPNPNPRNVRRAAGILKRLKENI